MVLGRCLRRRWRGEGGGAGGLGQAGQAGPRPAGENLQGASGAVTDTRDTTVILAGPVSPHSTLLSLLLLLLLLQQALCLGLRVALSVLWLDRLCWTGSSDGGGGSTWNKQHCSHPVTQILDCELCAATLHYQDNWELRTSKLLILTSHCRLWNVGVTSIIPKLSQTLKVANTWNRQQSKQKERKTPTKTTEGLAAIELKFCMKISTNVWTAEENL